MIGITSESVIDIASERAIDIASESVIDMPRNTQQTYETVKSTRSLTAMSHPRFER